MTELDVKWCGELRVIDIKPGDHFVLRIIGAPLSSEHAAHIQQTWKKFCEGKDIPLLVIESRASLEKIDGLASP